MTDTDAILITIQDAGANLRRILETADAWSVPAQARAPAEAVLAAWGRAGQALLRASGEGHAAVEPLEARDYPRALGHLEAADAAVQEAERAFADADRAVGELDPRAWAVAGVRWMVAGALDDPSGEVLRRQLRELGFSSRAVAWGDLAGAFYHVFTREPRAGTTPAWERAVRERGPETFLGGWLRSALRHESRRRAGEPHPGTDGEAESLRSPDPSPLALLTDRDALAELLSTHGLSPREADLAWELAWGDAPSLAEAGREVGMTPSTTRTVAERLRKKIGPV